MGPGERSCIWKASARPRVADDADASSKRVSQINTSRRKPCCRSSADRKRRYSARQSVRLFDYKLGRNSTTDNRSSRSRACNMRMGNNTHHHTLLRKVLLHIRLALLPDPRKESTVEMIDCGTWS